MQEQCKATTNQYQQIRKHFVLLLFSALLICCCFASDQCLFAQVKLTLCGFRLRSRLAENGPQSERISAGYAA
jgi:hypothetical protein